MDNNPIHIDEFGTLRFTIFQDDGHSYEFEQEAEADYLFITLRDPHGRALGKKVIDIEKYNNKDILEIYNDYLREQGESDEKQQGGND